MLRGGVFPGAGYAALRAHNQITLVATVQPDSAHGGGFTHSETQLVKYRAHMDWWQAHTLGLKSSRDLIHSIARRL